MHLFFWHFQILAVLNAVGWVWVNEKVSRTQLKYPLEQYQCSVYGVVLPEWSQGAGPFQPIFNRHPCHHTAGLLAFQKNSKTNAWVLGNTETVTCSTYMDDAACKPSNHTKSPKDFSEHESEAARPSRFSVPQADIHATFTNLSL